METDTATSTTFGDGEAMDTDEEQRLLEDALADPDALSMFDALIDEASPAVAGGEDFSTLLLV